VWVWAEPLRTLALASSFSFAITGVSTLALASAFGVATVAATGVVAATG